MFACETVTSTDPFMQQQEPTILFSLIVSGQQFLPPQFQ